MKIGRFTFSKERLVTLDNEGLDYFEWLRKQKRLDWWARAVVVLLFLIMVLGAVSIIAIIVDYLGFSQKVGELVVIFIVVFFIYRSLKRETDRSDAQFKEEMEKKAKVDKKREARNNTLEIEFGEDTYDDEYWGKVKEFDEEWEKEYDKKLLEEEQNTKNQR